MIKKRRTIWEQSRSWIVFVVQWSEDILVSDWQRHCCFCSWEQESEKADLPKNGAAKDDLQERKVPYAPNISAKNQKKGRTIGLKDGKWRDEWREHTMVECSICLPFLFLIQRSKNRNSKVIGLAYHLVFVSSARDKNRSIKLLTYSKGSLI